MLLSIFQKRYHRITRLTEGIDMSGSTVLAAMLLAASPCIVKSASLCSAEEKTVFNCHVNGSRKVASICSGDHLVYRYGLPGKSEFAYPIATDGADKDHFRYSATRSADYSAYEYALEFSNQGFSYVAYWGEKRRPDGTKHYIRSSVTVWRMDAAQIDSHTNPAGKIVKTLECRTVDGVGLVSLKDRNLPPANLPTLCLTCPGR